MKLRTILFVLAGATGGYFYGVLLTFFAGLVGGAGHGLIFLSCWFVSPLGMAPYFWAAIGMFLCFRKEQIVRPCLTLVLIANYAVAALTALHYGEIESEILHAFEYLGISLLVVCSYLLGQLVVWGILLRKPRATLPSDAEPKAAA